MCAACEAAQFRLRAAQRLAVAAYDENFGIDVGLRRLYRPVVDHHEFDRELGRLDVVEALSRKG